MEENIENTIRKMFKPNHSLKNQRFKREQQTQILNASTKD